MGAQVVLSQQIFSAAGRCTVATGSLRTFARGEAAAGRVGLLSSPPPGHASSGPCEDHGRDWRGRGTAYSSIVGKRQHDWPGC